MDRLTELYGSPDRSVSLSYSRLSDFDRNGPKVLLKRTFINNDGEAIKIGSLVDDLLLDRTAYNEKYFIFDGAKPTATLGKLCDIILTNYREVPDQDQILEIIRDNSFWKRSKDEVVIGNFDNPEFWNYIKAKMKATKLQLITTEELFRAQAICDVLLTHPYSKSVFNNRLDNHNQFKFEMDYRGFKFRGIVDKMIINHEEKTIQLIDLKTGKAPAKSFTSSFINWRYYLQEAIYMKAFDFICEQLNLEGYKLLPFKFLYISRGEKIPLLYTVNTKWHEAAIEGFQTTEGYTYRGLDEILDEVEWHYDNNEFEVPKFMKESNGDISLDDSFIVLKK